MSVAASALGEYADAAQSSITPADTQAEDQLIRWLAGRSPILSSRVHLAVPAIFSNGYSVPLDLDVDSPMTESNHVRSVQVIAPRNPVVAVAVFRFTPQSGRVALSTRIRLAEPQNVVALVEMNDATMLMARTWVRVDTNGCA